MGGGSRASLDTVTKREVPAPSRNQTPVVQISLVTILIKLFVLDLITLTILNECQVSEYL